MSATETAFAKINLALHVRRRRADGYHDLETVFAFCEDGDRIALSTGPELTIEGPFAAGLDAGPANLVRRAADALRAAFGIGEACPLRLEKNLPVASGIGGGSADAAAALRLLCRRWGIDLADPRIAAIAAALGADVPACLMSRSAFGTGRGDVLRPLGDGWSGMPVLLVNPRAALSTGAVFAAWDGDDRGALDPARPLAGRNDLEAPARRLLPGIGEVLGFLGERRGVSLARMSGSGATCFALFDDAGACAAALTEVPAPWWAMASRLR